MNLILLLVVVVAAGAVLSVQAAINGRLGQTVGVLRGSLVTFVVGAIVTALLRLKARVRGWVRPSQRWLGRFGLGPVGTR